MTREAKIQNITTLEELRGILRGHRERNIYVVGDPGKNRDRNDLVVMSDDELQELINRGMFTYD